MKKTLFFIAAIIWTACSSDQVQERDLPDKGRILIVEATKGQTNTRGLNLDDNTLKASWEQGDEVSVLFNGEYIGKLTPTKYGDAATTLTGSIKDEVDVKGKQLTLIFPGINHDDDNSIRKNDSRDYTGQIGTLENIAKYYDYATASVTVKDIEGPTVTTNEAAEFENQQAIVRFTLKYGSNDLDVTSLTIAADGLLQTESSTGPITITPKAATNVIYAALSGVNGIVTITATDGSHNYFYTTPDSKTFTNGRFYSVTVKMKKEYPEPLTLECFDETCTSENKITCDVTVTDYGDLEYYQSDIKEWKEYTSDTSIQLFNGEWVSFRGTNATADTGSSEYMNIQCTGKCYVYGNVMSLLDKENFATKTDLPYDHTFQDLFMDNGNIFHDDGKDLVLPATKLVPYCYNQMFSGCVNMSYIKCLATDIPANNDCTTDWLKGAGTYILDNGGTCTFVMAEGFEGIWEKKSASGIPDDWDIIEE